MNFSVICHVFNFFVVDIFAVLSPFRLGGHIFLSDEARNTGKQKQSLGRQQTHTHTQEKMSKQKMTINKSPFDKISKPYRNAV